MKLQASAIVALRESVSTSRTHFQTVYGGRFWSRWRKSGRDWRTNKRMRQCPRSLRMTQSSGPCNSNSNSNSRFCDSEIAHGPLPCLPVPRRLTNVCTVARVSDKGKECSPEREPATQLGPTHIYVVCTLQAMWHGMIVGTDLSGSHNLAQDLAPPKRGFSFGCWNLLGPHAVWQARCILDLTSTAVAELRRRTARQRRLTRRQEAHSTSWRAVGLPSLNRRIGWTSTTATGNARKNRPPQSGGYKPPQPVDWVAAITSPNASLFNHGNQEEAHMSRITALFVGIAALTIVSTVAEAADGCGRG